MKIRIILLFTFILWTVAAISQTETAAVKILDKFSSAALSAPSVSMKFKLATDDFAENSRDTLSGSVIISKDKYRLELPDNIVWFTGDASWSYLPAEKEVTVTKPDKKDNSFQNKPSGIFTMYKKGYKIRLIDENASISTIDLYPEDIKSEIIRIRLTIGKTSNDLMRLEYKRNDGVILTVMVSEYNLKFKPDQETFVFKPEKYKGIEIVDMR